MRVYFEMHRLLPESVVWLCANNRVAEAEEIIRNAAKMNNIKMPDKILARSDTSESPADDKADDGDKTKSGKWKLMEKFRSRRNGTKSEKTEDGSARYTLLDIFRNRHLTVNMFCMLILWSVASFTTITFYVLYSNLLKTRNTFCGTWYLPHSRVHKSMIELRA